MDVGNRKGAETTVHVFLWGIGVLAVIVVALAGGMVLQYRRYRQSAPRPPYKQPARRVRVADLPEDGLTVCWIGHSTLFIRWNGLGILTDPVFSERVGLHLGPVAVGPRRHTAPAMTLADVAPHVDLILLSHAHMDHFDMPTLRALANARIEVITAAGTSRLLRHLRFRRVRELHGEASVTTECGIRVTAVPVRHWGARYPWNKRYGWTGYLLEHAGQRLFFAGDTAHVPSFTHLRAHGAIDVVCMPIGAYAPASFQSAHCTPEQAWQMFVDTGGTFLVPMHWDTFVLSQEPVDEPLRRLLAAAGEQVDKVVVRAHGDVFTVQPSYVPVPTT